MTRKTLYGTLTHNEVMNENEKAMLYIKECAELVGLEVIKGKTAFSITFMAEVMKRLREKQESVIDRIRAEIADLDNDDQYDFEGYYKAVNDVLQIIDKYNAEIEPQAGSNECMFSDYPDMPYQYDNMTGSMNL